MQQVKEKSNYGKSLTDILILGILQNTIIIDSLFTKSGWWDWR